MVIKLSSWVVESCLVELKILVFLRFPSQLPGICELLCKYCAVVMTMMLLITYCWGFSVQFEATLVVEAMLVWCMFLACGF